MCDDIFLEVQNKTYSEILHLIDYTIDGFRLWSGILIFNEIFLRARDPVFKDPVLRSIERSAPEGFDLCVFSKLLHICSVCSETFDTFQNRVFENWVLRM